MATFDEWFDAVRVSLKAGGFIGPEGAKAYREQEAMSKLAGQVQRVLGENPEAAITMKADLGRAGISTDGKQPADLVNLMAANLSRCGISLPENANLDDIRRATTQAVSNDIGGKCSSR